MIYKNARDLQGIREESICINRDTLHNKYSDFFKEAESRAKCGEINATLISDSEISKLDYESFKALGFEVLRVNKNQIVVSWA